MRDVENKVAFVTGGASGIGLGIARAFLEVGMRVIIGDNHQGRLDAALNSLSEHQRRVHPILVDVTNRQGLRSAAIEMGKVFGPIHVLMNNAGIQDPSTLMDISYEAWDKVMRVNVGGILNGLHVFVPLIKQHGEGGQVITTASMVGLFTVGAAYGAYCASKFAAVGMMETLRSDLHEQGIGVSILCPGPVRSNLESFLENSPLALDPLEVGRLTLRGMRENALYILTHPEFNPLIQARSDAILASAPSDMHPNVERNAVAQSTLRSSVYLQQGTQRPP